jgi:hypothetical protein
MFQSCCWNGVGMFGENSGGVRGKEASHLPPLETCLAPPLVDKRMSTLFTTCWKGSSTLASFFCAYSLMAGVTCTDTGNVRKLVVYIGNARGTSRTQHLVEGRRETFLMKKTFCAHSKVTHCGMSGRRYADQGALPKQQATVALHSTGRM